MQHGNRVDGPPEGMIFQTTADGLDLWQLRHWPPRKSSGAGGLRATGRVTAGVLVMAGFRADRPPGRLGGLLLGGLLRAAGPAAQELAADPDHGLEGLL